MCNKSPQVAQIRRTKIRESLRWGQGRGDDDQVFRGGFSRRHVDGDESLCGVGVALEDADVEDLGATKR